MLELRIQMMINDDEAIEIYSLINSLLKTNFLTDRQRLALTKMSNQIEEAI